MLICADESKRTKAIEFSSCFLLSIKYYKIILVGDESLGWNTLLFSLIVLSEKLEEFGHVYVNNMVIVIEPEIPVALIP